MGYVDPTPIQLRTIPLGLAGKDIIGSAQTGTGKTAAFALPILSHLNGHGNLRVLVLEPTRELASQVETAFRDYSRFTDLKTTVIYGGCGYSQQERSLREADIVVATPGRLIDHIQRRTIDLRCVNHLVLDEADRMLDMGFMPDVKRIIEACPKKRQTLLFSATMPPEISDLSRWAMHQPEVIEIGHRRSPAETITHAMYPVASEQKTALLLEMMERLNYDSLLVFTRTKHKADRIAQLLKRNGHAVAVLHSNRTQREREQALRGFRDGRFEVMVATDIAARGLDVESITHVINYDIPQHPEDYVHRIGRTGRAEATGDAITLCAAEDWVYMKAIEKFIARQIERKTLENFDYVNPPSLDRHVAKPPPRSGGHRGQGGGYGGNRQGGGGRNFRPNRNQGGGQGEHRSYNQPRRDSHYSAPSGPANEPIRGAGHRQTSEPQVERASERAPQGHGGPAPKPWQRGNNNNRRGNRTRPWENKGGS